MCAGGTTAGSFVLTKLSKDGVRGAAEKNSFSVDRGADGVAGARVQACGGGPKRLRCSRQ